MSVVASKITYNFILFQSLSELTTDKPSKLYILGPLWESSPHKCRKMFHAMTFPLQWRRNGHDGVSNHQSHDCLLNRLLKAQIKETSKLCVTGLCEGNSPGTSEYPAQKASNAENVSIWWRNYVWWRRQNAYNSTGLFAFLCPDSFLLSGFLRAIIL